MTEISGLCTASAAPYRRVARGDRRERDLRFERLFCREDFREGLREGLREGRRGMVESVVGEKIHSVTVLMSPQ